MQTDHFMLVIAVGVDMTLQTKASGAEGLQFDKVFFEEHTFQNSEILNVKGLLLSGLFQENCTTLGIAK